VGRNLVSEPIGLILIGAGWHHGQPTEAEIDRGLLTCGLAGSPNGISTRVSILRG